MERTCQASTTASGAVRQAAVALFSTLGQRRPQQLSHHAAPSMHNEACYCSLSQDTAYLTPTKAAQHCYDTKLLVFIFWPLENFKLHMWIRIHFC